MVVPTRNSSKSLDACLSSIKEQTYNDIELIIVDNNSTDDTRAIAKSYTSKVFNRGPERSAQRNYGVLQASGELVLIVDSDMELSPNVVFEAVNTIVADPRLTGVIIPEVSFGSGFWAKCKALERSYYVGVEWMEAARFFYRESYLNLGGYNEGLTSGEDWEFSQRMAEIGCLSRIEEYINHNEQTLRLSKVLSKKYYYGKTFAGYIGKSTERAHASNISKQKSLFTRYCLYFAKPKKLVRNPAVGLGMIFMKSAEFAIGGLGLVVGKRGHTINEEYPPPG